MLDDYKVSLCVGKNKRLNVTIYDTPNDIDSVFYKPELNEIDVALFCYAVNDIYSLQSLEFKWMENVKANCSHRILIFSSIL